jgi:hypothetical protein
MVNSKYYTISMCFLPVCLFSLIPPKISATFNQFQVGDGDKKRGTPELGWLSRGLRESKLNLMDGDFAETFGATAGG